MPTSKQKPTSQANAALIEDIRRTVSEAVSESLAKSNQPDRMMRIDEVRHVTGLCQTAIYECQPLRAAMVKMGRNSFWPASKVHAFVESMKANTAGVA